MQLEKEPLFITTIEESPTSQFEKSTLPYLERSPLAQLVEFPCHSERGGCKRQLEMSRSTANKEWTPTAMRVDRKLYLESNLPHIALRK